jgi:hypothetical protein
VSSYRVVLAVVTGLGAVPAAWFGLLFLVLDRPAHWDRVAKLIRDLAVLLMIGYVLPFVLVLLPGVTLAAPQGWVRWTLSIGVRLFADVWMWKLLWVYLTPRRDRQRRGRHHGVDRDTTAEGP